MLTLQLDDFMVEFEDGTVKHVGPSTADATVKLYHASTAEARAFGDQVKLSFADGEGNEVEVALSPANLDSLVADVRELQDDATGE